MEVTTASALDAALAELDGRGRGFERLVAWWMKNDPEWRARIKRVWHWDDWSGRWGPDRGIDLVAETVAGEFIAVQAKHVAPTRAIKKSEIDSFLSESGRPVFAERLLCATTTQLVVGARSVIENQAKPVQLALRDRLEESIVDWGAFERQAPSALEPARPKPHQHEAIAEVLKGFRDAARGQLIMPCGTGKTLTSMWIAEKLEAQTVLVVVPTLVLLRQTAQVWMAHSSRGYDLLKVCSDGAGDDDPELRRAGLSVPEVGGRITTDPRAIAEFMMQDGGRLIVSTYDSTPRVAEALQRCGEQFDVLICDEAHHCAGVEGKTHRTPLEDKLIPARKRLFVTATPTVFAASAHEQAAHAHLTLASMDDSTVFGRILHKLTFCQAVNKGLLCPYRVVIELVRDDEVNEMIRRRRIVTTDGGDHRTTAYNLAAQIACLRTMHRYDGRRLVAFHPTVEHSRDFADDLHLAADLLGEDERPANVHAAHVDGYMSRSVREAEMRRFLSDDEAPQLLSNVRLLAEGLDVPGIDGIFLIDTHRSAASIAQAVGRAVRKAPGKTIGTVLLPILVREGEDPDTALRSSEHKPVLDVLAALRTIDADIVNTIDSVRIELGAHSPASGRGSVWTVDAPTAVDEEFAQAIELSVVDLLNARKSRPKSTPTEQTQGVQLEDWGSSTSDWSDPATLVLGLKYAEEWDAARKDVPVHSEYYKGFPLEDWWNLILARWQERPHSVPDGMKRRCAEIFDWIAVSAAHYPTARRELAALDPLGLPARIDAWMDLHRVGIERDDEDLWDLAGLHIGRGGSLRTRIIVERIPEDLGPERRAELALEALKLAGKAIAYAEDTTAAVNGFYAALDAPGRPHELDTGWKPGRKPRTPIECSAAGWDAGQRVIKLIDRATGASRSSRNQRPRQRRGRRPSS